MKQTIVNLAVMLAVVVGSSSAFSAADVVEQGAQIDGLRYEHSRKKSRFDVGAGELEQVDGTYQRFSGERGVFVTDVITGATLGVLSAPSVAKGLPVRAELPHLPRALTDDPAQHSAAVRDYLLAAGVPAREVSGSHVTTTMAGGGPVEYGVQPSQSRLLWYTTHLERSLVGIPVEGSFAFAAFDSEGKAITEGVYWPAIPASVVGRALTLKRRLATEGGLRSFQTQALLARPDVSDTAGEVKIVHTGPSHHGSFEAKAVYSVVVRHTNGGKAQIVRFDDTASPTLLADEIKRTGESSLGDSPKVR